MAALAIPAVISGASAICAYLSFHHGVQVSSQEMDRIRAQEAKMVETVISSKDGIDKCPMNELAIVEHDIPSEKACHLTDLYKQTIVTPDPVLYPTLGAAFSSSFGVSPTAGVVAVPQAPKLSYERTPFFSYLSMFKHDWLHVGTSNGAVCQFMRVRGCPQQDYGSGVLIEQHFNSMHPTILHPLRLYHDHMYKAQTYPMYGRVFLAGRRSGTTFSYTVMSRDAHGAAKDAVQSAMDEQSGKQFLGYMGTVFFSAIAAYAGYTVVTK